MMMNVKIGDVLSLYVDDKLIDVVVYVIGKKECLFFDRKGELGYINYDDIKGDMVICNIFGAKGEER